jgi:hypothetical protein
MNQLGNLAIICAQRKDTLLQILNGTATVHVGAGPDKRYISADWHDNAKINDIIFELNYGKYAERGGAK